MRFSKLRLLGFKSFVDPTELIIADGLTGVVGPNGCGKSNLLEALRWVMGENRPTAMRGGGMEDVIFAGAASRPARNYAEVTLSLDNTDRLAPPAFNASDYIDVVRRITRDAGSAYKVLGKEARARDVQMLFADASTGAHSPALVRQGQISELVNAKPRARRRVLEEAAGISGLYQRRHEAELKLNGTQANLTRVEDILEQLASQLAILERQAKQAARYREISDDLRKAEGLLLFRRWSEADETRLAADRQLADTTAAAAQAQGQAARDAAARTEAEGGVPPLREEEAIAGAIVQRLLVERDTLDAEAARAHATIETLTAQIAELGGDRQREATLGADADTVIKELTWEAEALAKAEAGHDTALDAARDAARTASAALQDEEEALERATEDIARAEARRQGLERRCEDSRGLQDRAQQEHGAAEVALAAARADLTEAEERLASETAATAGAQSAAKTAAEALDTAEHARAAAQTKEAETRAALSQHDGEVAALSAEVSALERLLSRDEADGAQLLDKVRVASGFEAALGAALADDLRAPEVDAEGTGWARLEAYAAPAPLPDGASPLSDRIDAPPVLSRRLSQIGLVDAADGNRLQAALQPGQRLVSEDGGFWRWDGYRAEPGDRASSTALVLAQRNRLEELAADLAEHSAARDAMADKHQAAGADLTATTEVEDAARSALKAADAAATEALRAQGRAETDLDMLQGRIETLALTCTRRQEDARDAAAALAAAEAELAECDDPQDGRAALEALKIRVSTARATMLEARGRSDDLRREGDARTKRQQEITTEVSGWHLRQETAAERLAELDRRIADAQTRLAEARDIPGSVAARRDALAGSIDEAEVRLKAAGDALAEGEAALRRAEEVERAAERAASDAREARARAEAVAEAAAIQVEQAAERIREDMDMPAAELLERLQIDPATAPSAEKLEIDVARLRRQRDALGAVNLRAEEDAREVRAEHDDLWNEKADLDAAVAKLHDGIESLNAEGRQRLLDAFDEVNRNFSALFRHLFGGGEANLVLVESDDPLEAGLEIMCQPPGKKLSTLSLLSGGEQTLTALSLIFAVFLANPSPICVLDEVDAPLDDANVTRFCDLLDEMTERTDTRFLIITHHAVTMARMDRLFGVTMAEQGVSQLVSVDLNEAEAIVA